MMEDVWKEIILSPLSPNPNAANILEAPSSYFCGAGDHLASWTAIMNWSYDQNQEQRSEENSCPVNHRHERIMKNRESAARSRARRLAYTFELEKDKSLLTEENARMRKELHLRELFLAAAAAKTEQETPKNPNLSRCFSALF